MANSVFLGASPFTVNGSAITIPTSSTFGWADAYFSRASAGVIQALGASGADTATVRALNLLGTNIGNAFSGTGGAKAVLTGNSIRFSRSDGNTANAIEMDLNSANGLYPVTNNGPALGLTVLRWSAVNAVNGDFSGTMKFGTFSALAAETLSGYITVTDAAGNTRKLGVIA